MLEDEALVSVLLAVGADPNRTSKARVVGGISATPLYAAAQCGNVSITRRLLTAGAKPNLPRGDGATPVMVAAQVSLRKHDPGRLLKTHPAAAARRRRRRHHHLLLVVRLNCSRVSALACPAAAALRRSTTINTECLNIDLARLMCSAVRRGALLRAGASPNAAMVDGSTALIVSAECGHHEVVAELLSNGAAVSRPNPTLFATTRALLTRTFPRPLPVRPRHARRCHGANSGKPVWVRHDCQFAVGAWCRPKPRAFWRWRVCDVLGGTK